MAKAKRATDKLNLAISSISAAESIVRAVAEGLPAGEARDRLINMAEQIDAGTSDAYEALREIKQAAESI